MEALPDGRPPRGGELGFSARTVAAGCVAGCARSSIGWIVALACLAGATLRAMLPPTPAIMFQPVVFRAGSFGVSMAVSGTPDCPPEIVDCSVPPQPNRLYGSVWFWVTGHNQTGVTSSFTPLLRLRLR